ncbi:calmodulin-lysine N-methyltransferase-like isoform X2 [Oscarella lobularis]|uniref:calmodulin-lysine N-methyltransferase-like isoform X2 n=1 Tax=Oscarella lobularis TaxID=121494 RepID=UPI003313BF36
MNSHAKRRWKFLKDCILTRNVKVDDDVSVRRFSTFQLLEVEPIDDKRREGKWLRYESRELGKSSLNIRHLTSDVSPSNLAGFNNTGNICVWPSEEVMAYYCLKQRDSFDGLAVCELGAGMTGLAALMVGAYSNAAEILVTDGNSQSVQNIERNIEANEFDFASKRVKSSILLWECEADFKEWAGHFDVILCADGLFFEDSHDGLIDTMKALLKPKGYALHFAPKRKHTLQAFCKKAEKNFRVEITEIYDARVWQKHQQALTLSSYDPDLHYPLMIRLEKY